MHRFKTHLKNTGIAIALTYLKTNKRYEACGPTALTTPHCGLHNN